MRKLVILTVLAVCVGALAGGGGKEPEIDDHDVLVVTDSNWDEIVEGKELILVEFYAPWCGHCKHLAPEYAQAATELLKNDPPIPLAKVDATVQTKVAGKFSISGYPTLKIFRDGKASDYNGPRKAAGIVSYMKKQVGPAAKQLDSVKAVEDFIKSDPSGYAVVGFFDQEKSKNSQLHSSFAVVSNKARDNYIFGKVYNADVANHFGATLDSLIAFKDYDDKKTVYSGASSTKAVEDWIKVNSLPVVGDITEENQEAYQKRDLPILKFFVPFERKTNQKQAAYFINRLQKTAVEHQGKLLVALANMNKWKEQAKQFGFEGKEYGMVIEKGYADKFKYEGKTFNADVVKAFAADYFDGKLEKWVKSEDEPENNNGPVKVVTGKNFDRIVNDPEKDVLIEFYAPWCGHCKSLAPKYEELGKKLKSVESVVVAKIDATANDYPKDFEVSGYPSLFFVPAKKGAKPIKYDGDREVDAMAKFIHKKAKVEFELPGGKKKKSKKEDL